MALRAMTDDGGVPSSAQLRRSVEPILGDLVPLPWLVLGEVPAVPIAAVQAASRKEAKRRGRSS